MNRWWGVIAAAIGGVVAGAMSARFLSGAIADGVHELLSLFAGAMLGAVIPVLYDRARSRPRFSVVLTVYSVESFDGLSHSGLLAKIENAGARDLPPFDVRLRTDHGDMLFGFSDDPTKRFPLPPGSRVERQLVMMSKAHGDDLNVWRGVLRRPGISQADEAAVFETSRFEIAQANGGPVLYSNAKIGKAAVALLLRSQTAGHLLYPAKSDFEQFSDLRPGSALDREQREWERSEARR